MRFARVLGWVSALLLVVSVVLTATRFSTAGVKLLAAPAAVSSYAAVGFVLALLLALVARARTRARAAATVAVLSLVGVGLHVLWAAPAYVANGEPVGDARLRVLTANLEFGGADARRLVADVRRLRVQVLVLEELTPPELSRLQAAGLSRLLPRALGTPAYSAAGTVVLSSLPIRELARPPLANGSIEVAVDSPVGAVRVIAVHTAQPFYDAHRWDRDLRTVRTVARTAVRRGPTVLAGDFNATTGHRQFRQVLREGLTDSVDSAGSGWQPTWPDRYHWSWTRPVVAIDHVLTSGQLTVVHTQTVELHGSDHRGLMAEIARG